MDNLLSRFTIHWTSVFSRLKGKSILLAISGGADSMAMAHLFQASGIDFGVAHCNFGLRGEASELDEALVRDWCLQNGVQFHSVKFDTKSHSVTWKKGIQETARILRYDWFETIRSEFKYAKIATAHHANDNVETLLINLFKGTGINGLHGIPRENNNTIRPLLFATRDELRAYVAENNVTYREDESNNTDDYLRNDIRHNLVPVIEKIFPTAVQNVNDSILRFTEAGELYNKAILNERKELLEKRGNDYYVPVRKLLKRQPVSTICYELFHQFGFTSAQLPHILNLLSSVTGHYIASSTHRIIRNRDFLVVTTLETKGADLITIQDANAIIDIGVSRFLLTTQDRPREIPTDSNLAYVDLNAISFPLILRKWRSGDYFYPLGMGMKKKKISRLLIDQKIPLHEKENIYVIECEKRIVWVSGIRLDERFKVKPATTKVLVLKKEAFTI